MVPNPAPSCTPVAHGWLLQGHMRNLRQIFTHPQPVQNLNVLSSQALKLVKIRPICLTNVSGETF